jgi:aminopeptidase N
MSANETAVKDLDESHRLYQFQSNIKIPSYLIALAVGNLEKV